MVSFRCSESLRVVEHNEAFVEEDGDLVFSHTKVILSDNLHFFWARTNRRYLQNSDIDLSTLDVVQIPYSRIWPVFPSHFARAPEPIPCGCYLKRPSLLSYGDTEASTHLSTLLLREAQMCELMKHYPHPNVAKYLGCLVHDGRIAGLCFMRYGETLAQRIRNGLPVDKDICLKSIRMGIEHLHQLGIVHCDINPNNIFTHGDSYVIGDFDSCTVEGAELGLKAGTPGWTDNTFKNAKRENDLYGLSKIEEFVSNQRAVNRCI